MTNEQLGWLCYFDAYGFGNEITRTDNAALIQRIRAVQTELRKFISKREVRAFFLSDSFIIFVPSEESRKLESLVTLSDCVRVAQLAGATNTLFFRGSVFFGKMTFEDDAIVGTPLLQAARLEAQLAYPVVVIPRSQFSSKDPLPKTAPRIVQLKDGILQAWAILPRPLNVFADAARAAYDSALVFGPPNVAQTWKLLLDELTHWQGEAG